MTFRKCSCSILFVSASLLGCSTIISSMTQQGRRLYSDGGAPQPPVPPKSTSKATAFNLVADGGAPQPPVPPKSTSKATAFNLVADGGAPQPPVPPKSTSKATAFNLVS